MLLQYTTDRRQLDIGDTIFYDHNLDVPGSKLIFAKIIGREGADVLVRNLKVGCEMRLPPTLVFGYANPVIESFPLTKNDMLILPWLPWS